MLTSLTANDIALLVGMIGLVSGIISVIVSLVLNRATIRGELNKLKLEVTNTYADRLQAKRIDVYPMLYGKLYVFARKMHSGEATFNDLEALHAEIYEWYRSYGIFLSSKSRDGYYRYYRGLDIFIKKGPEAFKKRVDDKQRSLQLLRDTNNFNLALQADIGIFDVEFFERGKHFDSYDDLTDALNNS